MKKRFDLNNFTALKKMFNLKTAVVVIAIMGALAMIGVPKYIQYSRDKAVKSTLQQIALAQMAIQPEGYRVIYNFVYTYVEKEKVKDGIKILTDFGFRPDPSVAFHIMPFIQSDSKALDNYLFIAFAAHNSPGSTVYSYNNITGMGIVETHENEAHGSINSKISSGSINYVYGKANIESIREARKKGVKADLSKNTPLDSLYCYTYDPANKEAPIKRNIFPTKIAPDPNRKYPARMVVTIASEN